MNPAEMILLNDPSLKLAGIMSAPLFTVVVPELKNIAVGPELVDATTLNTTENNIPCPGTVSTLESASSAELVKLVVSFARMKFV